MHQQGRRASDSPGTISEEEARSWLANIIPAAYVSLLVAQWRDEVGVAH